MCDIQESRSSKKFVFYIKSMSGQPLQRDKSDWSSDQDGRCVGVSGSVDRSTWYMPTTLGIG